MQSTVKSIAKQMIKAYVLFSWLAVFQALAIHVEDRKLRKKDQVVLDVRRELPLLNFTTTGSNLEAGR